MIDPRHSCYYVRTRTSDVRLIGHIFSSVGVSLRVLGSAFLDGHLVWFSLGASDGADIVAVGLATTEASLPEDRIDQTNGPVKAAIGDQAEMAEYVLTDRVQRQLGILALPEGALPENLPSNVRCFIDIHDDCFARVTPVSSAEDARKLVGAVLQLHSFYLGREVDWTDVLEGIVEILKLRGEIRLRSNPKRQMLSVGWKRGGSWVRRLWAPREYREVAIDRGIARFASR